MKLEYSKYGFLKYRDWIMYNGGGVFFVDWLN